MTSSIPIPTTRNINNKQPAHAHRTSSSSSSYYPYHASSTPGSSYASSHHHHHHHHHHNYHNYSSPSVVGSSPDVSSKSGKGKGKEREVEVVVQSQPRRASLLGTCEILACLHAWGSWMSIDLGSGRGFLSLWIRWGVFWHCLSPTDEKC